MFRSRVVRMAYAQSRVERFWNAFGLVVCLTAASDIAYRRRNVWEGLLFLLLLILAGNLFARLVGLTLPASGLNGAAGRQGPL
jgi:hypothetical protein